MGRPSIVRAVAAAVLLAVVVPMTAASAQVSTGQPLPESLTGALVDKLGLDPSQAPRWSDGVVDVGDDWWAFGWGGDASAPATVSEQEAPWTVPVAIGVNYVQWQDPARLPDFGEFAVANGMLTGSVNGGPQLNRTYAVMTAVMGGDIPLGVDMDLFQQWDFVLGIPGLDFWHALPQYPDDTWNGGAFVASLAYGPNPWSLNFYTFDGGIDSNPLGGFGIISGNTLILGVEADPNIFSDGVPEGPFNASITGRLALDVKDAPANPNRSRVVTAPAGPHDETTFFGYLGNGHTIVPGLPGLFDPDEIVAFVGPDGNLWFKVYPWDPWGAEPPYQYFSDYLQVSFGAAGSNEAPSYVGFQTHDGVDQPLAGAGSETSDLPDGFIMNDGALLFGTGVPYEGEPLQVYTQGGFLLTEGGQFQGTQWGTIFYPSEIETSEDPEHFDDEYPVYDLTTGESVSAPSTTTIPRTTAPPSSATTTTLDTTTQRPHISTTSRSGTCWWCWGIIALLFAFLIYTLYSRLKTYEWWTCWIPWGWVIWVWTPFLLAGLWWWSPSWWWWPLLAWFVVIGGYTWSWARLRSWWRPWMFWVVGGYLAALVVGMVVVGSPTWGLLFPLFWLPPVAFHLWYRPRRQPWWRPWMWVLFAAYVVWVFIWVIWLTPYWGWWFPVFYFPFLGWWFITHDYTWREIRRKSWWLVPWCLIAWLAFMLQLYSTCC